MSEGLARALAAIDVVNAVDPKGEALIAGRLGMKPESLSRAFARLKEQGVTIKQNTAQIEDLAALRDYVEEDPALAWSKGGL